MKGYVLTCVSSSQLTGELCPPVVEYDEEADKE